ncbi:MAG: hypothetical protein JWR67_3603 [Mucilaginibacter sp.]|jgi:hypothetical protein|nr:hypothetical protein [Mucilaginibacter sp.]
MRNDRLVPGLILVMIGGIFLLHNYGYIHFHWMNFVYLWPIFIVIGGVNLIFAHNRSPWATIIKVAVVVIGFGLLVFGNFGNREGFWPHGYYSFRGNDNIDDEDNSDDSSQHNIVKVEGNSFFNQPYTTDARIVRLNVRGGGTTYNLSDTTNQLFSAATKEFMGRYDFSHRKEDSVYVLDFSMKKNHMRGFHWNSQKSNAATFKLNVNPEWEINVETGATKLNFDLSKFKIKSLKLSGGAASFDVKLGQPLAATNVEISTGISEVNIDIPQNAACRIQTDSGLSSNQFDGFNKKDDNNYETANFVSAKNKIYINISGGISDFKVHRY